MISPVASRSFSPNPTPPPTPASAFPTLFCYGVLFYFSFFSPRNLHLHTHTQILHQLDLLNLIENVKSQREPRAGCRQQLMAGKLIRARRGQPGHVRANASQIPITHYSGHLTWCPTRARQAEPRLGLSQDGVRRPQATRAGWRVARGEDVGWQKACLRF